VVCSESGGGCDGVRDFELGGSEMRAWGVLWVERMQEEWRDVWEEAVAVREVLFG
jgi:hypothetical protein